MYLKIYSSLLVCLIFCITTKAQIAKNAIFLGGALNLSTGKTDYPESSPDTKSNAANLSIRTGKAFKENWIAGVKVAYGSSLNKSDDGSNDYKATNNQYGFGVFIRNYKKLAKDFYMFFEGGADYSFFKQKNTSSGQETNSFNQEAIAVSLSPGMSYRLYKKMYGELLIPSLVSLNYNKSKQYSDSGTSTTNSLLFNTNLNIITNQNFGIGLHFII